MNDAQHQDVDMAPSKLPVRAIQGEMPWLSRQPHEVDNQAGDTSFIKVDMLKKTFKTTMHG